MADRIRRRRDHHRRMARKRQKRLQTLFGLILACIALVCGISYFMLHKYVSKHPDDVISENIYIGNVNVSGLTKKEAMQEMEAHLAEDQKQEATLLVGSESVQVALEEMGLSYQDIEKAVDQAVAYGNKGSVLTRYWKLKKLKKEKVVIEEVILVDDEKTAAVLKKQAVPLADHAQDAAISRTSSGFSIEKEKEGTTVDIEKSIAALEEYLNGSWNHKDLKVELVLKKEEPKVTSADLESIQDELGTFSTDAGGGERHKNLEAGVEHIDGTVVMPGEEVSVHDLTAPYDEENGYVPAGSYENGQVVDTYGGGICQVSTTFYNALLFAELEIVERYPHSMLVNYVEPSMDAAIAGDLKDLKFKNNLETPIYVAAEIDSANQMRFTIYGKETRPENRSLEFVSETVATEEYEVKYVEDSQAALGTMTYDGSPHTGKTAKLWKVIYEDGKEVDREVVNNSNYNKADQVIKVGTASDNAQASALVRQAIATQDQSKINAAISQAGGI